MLHAALLLWVAGTGHLLHGNVDLHAMAWLLVGSIPGVLLGSKLSVRVPERALRFAFAFVLVLSGIKLVELPAATLIIEVFAALGGRRSRRGSAYGPAAPLRQRRLPRPRRRVESPGVARVLSTAIVLALLAATAVAFAITEGAKLEKSPIAGRRHAGLLAGRRDQRSRTRTIRSGCGRASGSSVWIEDARRHRVATCSRRSAPARLAGRPRLGRLLRQRRDRPRRRLPPVVKLERSHRTIVLPSPIRLDTKPPVITVRHPQYPIISPDGDGHNDVPRPLRVERAGARDPRRARRSGSSSRAARSRR